MIDFDQMTRNILWEFQSFGMPSAGTPPQNTTPPQSTGNQTQQTTTTPQPSTNQSEDAEVKQEQANLFGFLTSTQTGYYSKLEQIWRSTFSGIYKFCTPDELNSLCYNVATSLPRATKTPDKFPNLESIYPLLDLIAQLYEFNFKKGSDNSTAGATYKKVIDNIAKQRGSNKNFKPLDYYAINPWVQSIKSAYLGTAKQELGKLRLEAQDKNSSIYQLIFNLLAIRKKGILPKLTAPIRTISGEGVIKNIMLEPWKLVSNKPYAINDQKLKVVYDDVINRELVNLSLAAYKLYQQQANSLLEKIDDTDTEARYKLFMGVGGAKPLPWKIGGGTFDTASFDQSLELLTKQLMVEAGQNDVDTRTPAEIMRAVRDNTNTSYMSRQNSGYSNFSSQITQASTNEELIKATEEKIKDPEFKSKLQELLDNADTDLLKAAEERIKDPEFRSKLEELLPKTDGTVERAFETGKGTNEFLYTFDNLKKASTIFKIDEATNLLKALQNFADYIKTKDPSTRDIMGGLTQIAQGIASLGKTMGT